MRIFSSRLSRLTAMSLPLTLVFAGEMRANAYDPLAAEATARPSNVDLTVQDVTRHRGIPLRVYLPVKAASAPVVLFSHGLGGSRTGSAFLGEHWAARGYVAVFCYWRMTTLS
ncbi:MAG TPA: hypothetical protein VN578_14530 [Candidatus Binatia bacterium]|jgi:predicted dienelactone hydrolase|nr:hypothetical protein [Candidatus Binatia bacterium]